MINNFSIQQRKISVSQKIAKTVFNMVITTTTTTIINNWAPIILDSNWAENQYIRMNSEWSCEPEDWSKNYNISQ